MNVREVNGKFKIWIQKNLCFMCELVNHEWRDLEFNTKEEAEKEVEQMKDHQKAIETGEWEWYAEKWGIELS